MFTERLSQNAKKVLAVLNQCLPPNTYLAGGTALAIQINHRESFDLDLYSPQEFNLNEIRQKMEKIIPDFKMLSTSWQTIIGQSGDTEVSLFYYKYPLVKKPIIYKNLFIASVADIAAMKIDAISGRGLKRDFFDLYSICQIKKIPLLNIVQFYQEKYQVKENTPHILKSLIYFIDAETQPERARIVDKDWQKVKEFFISETTKLTKELLK